MAPKPAKPPAELPDVEPRDEIYFRHPRGAGHGKVLSRGQHGCWVSLGKGKRIKVRWEDFLGHKVRVQADAKVINKGEDGFLVQSKGGHKRFVRDPMGVLDPLAPEEPMRKAMPVVLLMGKADELAKAAGGGGPIKNRPGLVLKPVTDSRGHQTQRWVRATQDPPGEHNMRHGHHVRFVHEGDHHEGTVNGEPGKHGVHVDVASGRQHQVPYGNITHHKAPGGSGGGDGKPPAAAGGDAGEEPEHEPFFTEEETRDLPEKARQPYDTWEELERHGAEGQKQFEEILGQVAKKLNLRSDKKPKEMTDADWESPDGHLFVGNLKGKERAQAKVDGEYDGDWSKVRDLIRGTISVATFGELRAAIKAVKAAGLTLQQQPKDKFAAPTHEGYRDLMTIVKLPNGMLAELQYHLKPMTAAKAVHHADYAESRAFTVKYGEPHPTDSWSDEDHAAFHAAVKRQRQGYDAAWKKAGGGA